MEMERKGTGREGKKRIGRRGEATRNEEGMCKSGTFTGEGKRSCVCVRERGREEERLTRYGGSSDERLVFVGVVQHQLIYIPTHSLSRSLTHLYV